MKNIYKMIFVALLASTYGCEKFLDVNENEDKVRVLRVLRVPKVLKVLRVFRVIINKKPV